MRDNPGSAAAATGPYRRSGQPAAYPRTDRTKTEAKQRGATAYGTYEKPPTAPLSAEAFNVLLAAELDHLRRRPLTGRNRSRSCPWPHRDGQNTDVWRDQLFAEIEQLAGELKRKVARVALFSTVQSSDAPPQPAPTRPP